jgi:hypothetical protein
VGPRGHERWIKRGWVRKIIRFWQKRSQNCDFLVFHSPSTLSTQKKHTGRSGTRVRRVRPLLLAPPLAGTAPRSRAAPALPPTPVMPL